MIRTAALLALAASGLGASASHAQTTVNRWIEFGPSGSVLARAIVAPVAPGSTATCPSLSLDGNPLAMAARSTATATFPVQECEASLPPGRSATIDGVTLKMPVASPRRIVVVGDTGCRLKGTSVQACNDPAAFPLARLSNYVASFKPDLIVHVGDYYYRETACPAALAGDGVSTGCGGSPFGDNWPSWNADWFTPAQAMMTAAPLALVRGNHESCARGQNGWFTLLDPNAYSAASVTCAAGSPSDFTPPYFVNAGSVQVLMFDASFANDATVTPGTVNTYRAQLTAALANQTKPTIMVLHKPAFGLIATANSGSSTTVSGGDLDAQSLFNNGVPQPIKLLLSGHIHNFQAVKVSNSAYAPQMVVGNSGTLLDPAFIPGNQAGNIYTMPGAGTAAPIVSTSDTSEFGFAVLDVVPGGFLANLYDLNGLPHGRCVIQTLARNLVCTN